jgi:amino acid transporter
MGKSKNFLGAFSLAMMNLAAILSLRNLPLMSVYGLAMVTFYAIAGLFFFIPTAFISAELASLFTEEGGRFAWIRRAIGKRTAFLCEWISFITTVASLTLTIVFLTTSFALTFSPVLSQNRFFICMVVIVMTWTATFLALRGTIFSSRIVAFASAVGTVLPAFLIVALTAHWLLRGNGYHIHLSWKSLWPDFSNFSNVSFLSGVMFAFAGIEMSSYYLRDVRDPRRTYPRAIFISTLLILLISILGSLSIAVVLPSGDIRLEAGIMQALAVLLNGIHASWLVPFVGFLIVFGGVAYIFAWIAGPVRGLYAVRHTGLLPQFLQKTDARGMPTTILFYQAAMVTALAVLFLLAPSMGLCFWIINVAASILMLFLYACLFVAGIVLRYKMPLAPRLYEVPGGNLGMILLGSVGLANVVFCAAVSFFVPGELAAVVSQKTFIISVSLTTFLMICPPFVFIALGRGNAVSR